MTQKELKREMKALRAYSRKICRSKKAARAFLQKSGFIDKNGDLARPYKN